MSGEIDSRKDSHSTKNNPEKQILKTLPYLELCHIQNFSIFRIYEPYPESQQTSKMEGLMKSVKGIIIFPQCSILAVWKGSEILRTLAYSEPCLFRHIEACLIIIVIITLTFFFYFNLTHFPKKFKKTCFLTTATSVSMLD